MLIKNKLDNSFGPAGSFAGKVLFFVGIILTCFYFSAFILVLAGAFVGFTFSGSVIDPDKKWVRFSNTLFGIIPTGKWITVDPSMKIVIKGLNQVYTAYSQGSRAVDIPGKDFRLMLCRSENEEIMPLAKAATLEMARTESEKIRQLLGLTAV